MNRRSATVTRLAHFVALSIVGLAMLGVGTARADEYLDAANRAAAATPGTRAVEKELFPALAAMDEPPIPVSLSRDGMRELMLAKEGDQTWDALSKWATAEPQKKVLEAMKTIADPDHIYILGIPYGKEGVDPAWVDAGLYAELGPEGLLYGTKFNYMKRLGWAAGLALFESARLANEGKGKESLDVLRDLVKLSRILMERAFAEEKADAMSLALIALERTRDVVFSYADSFTAEDIKGVVEDIESKALQTDKIPLPEADKQAAEQIVARTFAERGAANPEALAGAMSQAEAGDRPLRLFSLAAWWASLAQGHADWFDTQDKIKGVWSDYDLRWKLDLNDPLLDRPSDFEQMDASKFGVVYEVMKGIEPLFDTRKLLWVDMGGTYDGLGVMAFKLQERNYPPQLAAIAPKYVKQRTKDLFNLDRRFMRAQMLDYPYWVPIRDQTFDRRERPHPYEVTVVLESGIPADALANVGAGSAFGDEMAKNIPESVRGIYSVLKSLPEWDDPAIDLGQYVTTSPFKIDMDGMRGAILGVVEKKPPTQESAGAMTAWIKSMIGENLSPSDIGPAVRKAWDDQIIGTVTAQLGGQQIPPEAMEKLKEGLSSISDVIESVVNQAAETQALTSAFETVRGGGSVSTEMADEIVRGAVSGVLSEKSEQMLEERMSDPIFANAVAAGVAQAHASKATSGKAFAASLDDSYFLLYSVGPNGKDDRAKSVGPAGVDADDILIWPPVITLERRFNH